MYNESPEMIKMLVRHGNSFALILDKPVLELLNIDLEKMCQDSGVDLTSFKAADAEASLRKHS